MDVNIAPRWMSFILSKQKVVEGRLNKGKFADIKPDSLLNFKTESGLNAICRVIDTRRYFSFQEYLENEGLRRTLPDISNIKDGLSLYRDYYEDGLDKTFGVLAIELELVE